VQAKAQKTGLAQTDWSQKRGLVLDYVGLNTSLTNYEFKGTPPTTSAAM
jgi:hypothetical protein